MLDESVVPTDSSSLHRTLDAVPSRVPLPPGRALDAFCGDAGFDRHRRRIPNIPAVANDAALGLRWCKDTPEVQISKAIVIDSWLAPPVLGVCRTPGTRLLVAVQTMNHVVCQYFGEMHLGSSKVNDNTDEIGVEDCLGRVSAKVLGTLQIRRGSEVLSAQQLGGPKSRQILEILLLHLGSAVSKGTLIDMLWMESAPSTAVSTLESYVSVLRRCLQPGQGKRGVLKTATGGYLLDADLIDLDLARFDSLLIRAEQCTGQGAAELFREALAMSDEPLLGNELLPEWAEAERNLHAARVTAARVRAAENALEMGAFGEAISLAQQVVDLDPLNEPAWSVMILAMERVKQPLRGLQAFEHCRRVMDRELGCQPGELLQQAQRRMLNETSSSNDDFSLVIRALLALENANNGAMEITSDNRSGMGPDGEITLIEAGSIVRGYVERMMTGAAV